MSDIPCKTCICYAICLSKEVVYCDVLWKYEDQPLGNIRASEEVREMLPNANYFMKE